MDVKTFKNEGKCVCVWLCVHVLVRGHAVCLLVLEVTFPRRWRVRLLRCVAIHTVGTARRDGYVAKAVNAQRTGTATLEQERGGERGRGGREGVCRQTKVRYQLLKAGQTNSVERPIEGRERVGGARRRMETPSSLSAVTVVQMGATLLSWAGHRSSCPGGHPMQSGSSWPRLHSAHPANETSLSVSWIVASFIYLPLFA